MNPDTPPIKVSRFDMTILLLMIFGCVVLMIVSAARTLVGAINSEKLVLGIQGVLVLLCLLLLSFHIRLRVQRFSIHLKASYLLLIPTFIVLAGFALVVLGGVIYASMMLTLAVSYHLNSPLLTAIPIVLMILWVIVLRKPRQSLRKLLYFTTLTVVLLTLEITAIVAIFDTWLMEIYDHQTVDDRVYYLVSHVGEYGEFSPIPTLVECNSLSINCSAVYEEEPGAFANDREFRLGDDVDLRLELEPSSQSLLIYRWDRLIHTYDTQGDESP